MRFLGWLQTTLRRQGNKRVAKRLWNCVNAERQQPNTCCNFRYRKIFYYTDRNTVCLEDLTFKSAQLLWPTGFLCGWSVGLEFPVGQLAESDYWRGQFQTISEDVSVCNVY